MALPAKLEKAIDEYGLRSRELERAHSAPTGNTTITEYRVQEVARAALVEAIDALLEHERRERREIVERFVRTHPEIDTRKLSEDLIGRALAPQAISDERGQLLERLRAESQGQSLWGRQVCTECRCADGHAPGCLVGQLLAIMEGQSAMGHVPPIPPDPL